MADIEHYRALADTLIQDYGYAAVFTGVFLESFGVPLPGESLVIASALVASEGKLHIVPLLAAVWSAAVLGDNVGYAIGLLGGRRLFIRYGSRVGITEARLARIEGFYRRYGGEVVLVARFFLLLRQLNGVVAGTMAMPWYRFLLYNALGALLWTAFWCLGVYLLGHDLAAALPWARHGGVILLAAVAVGGAALLIVKRFRKPRSVPRDAAKP